MEVSPGYKQTEVGVIPEDWDVVPMSQTARRITRGASPRPIGSPVWFDSQSSVGWVRISDVTQSGRYLTETTQRLSEAGIRNSRPVPSGSLIMSICATVGRPIETRIDTCIHDGFVVFDQPTVHQPFLFYLLSALEPSWSKRGQTGSQMNLNTGLINGRPVPLPPTMAEQRVIASALSDADALLVELERLIAKKSDLKQAVMQQLLTGKTRLPGFKGEWKRVSLGQIISRFSTGLNPRQYFRLNSGGNFFYVTIKNFKAGQLFLDEKCDQIDEAAFWRINERSDLRQDDVLFSSIGRIGDAYLILETPRSWNINESVFTLRPDPKQVVPLMLFYLLTSRAIKDALGQSVTGSTFKSIKQAQLKAIQCRLPTSHEEQTAIATALSDIDAELAALEARSDKTRDIKQAMMQELLSGRTRLI